MTQKWNLQDIRPAEPRRKRISENAEANTLQTNHRSEAPQMSRTPDYREDGGTVVIKNGNKERRVNYLLLGVAALVVIGGIFGLSAVLSKTTLTVYPEFSEPTVNAEFIAYPDKRDGQLAYEILTLKTEGERQVIATGQETVSEQAKGMIEIVKITPGAERLIKNTRFRSPSGLVYRIQESVVVPGALNDTTGRLVPGTIQAEVFADSAGQNYNLPAGTRFDVPGFADSNLTELYNAIYATNREPISGGFSGPRFIIDESLLATTKQALQVELRNELLAKIVTESPADFVAFPGAIAITYNSLPTISQGENLVTIREEAVLQLPLFRSADFASYIAKETVPSYMREIVRIDNEGDLTFAYTDAGVSNQNIANLTALNFTILGKPRIVWEFDDEKLKADLAGKYFTAISVVLTGHTGIKSAEISGKPFWKRSFPTSASDIVVIEVVGDRKP